MEVRNSMPSSSPYYAQGGGATPARNAAQISQQRDQIVSLGAPIRSSIKSSNWERGAINQEVALKSLTLARKVAMGIAALALSVIVLMLAQPLLAVVLTFGMCLFFGCQEWWEFTREMLSLSLWPAACLLSAIFLGLGINLKMHNIAQEMTIDPLASDPLRFLARKNSKR